MTGNKDKTIGPRGRRPPLGRKQGRGLPESRSEVEALRQLHELKVHQLELEMQNEELQRTRAELHASLTRYTELYEFAPVGYLTLSAAGAIKDLNQVAAKLLGGKEAELRHRHFVASIAVGSVKAFTEFMTEVFHSSGARECELEMHRPGGEVFTAQLTAALQGSTQTCLMAIADVTARRHDLSRTQDAEHLAQQLLQQNRHLTRRMFESLEEDRRRVVQELHNELGRNFSAIYHEIAMVLHTEHQLSPGTRANIRSITANLAEMQNGLRRILLRLRPTLLDLAGIGEALREFASNWKEQNPGIVCELALEGDLRGIPEDLSMALFRVVQEAMTNVAKHAKASRVVVRVSRTEGQINLVVDDNGDGFDAALVAPGVGLVAMRERIIALDGQFELVSQPEHGVRVEVWLPTGLPPEEPPREPRLDA
jgi:PAS domain S-box-containing protein